MIDYLLENGIKSVVFWVIGLVALGFATVIFGIGSPAGSAFPSVPHAKWQAVFLTNNQVYFGKLKDTNDSYLSLSDVYYLRQASDLNAAGAGNLNLIKLGGEVHGPEDTIFIPKQSVLYWENLKDSSRVVQTINSTKQ